MPSRPEPPRGVIPLIMGVSGSGKTTVGAMLAGRLGWPYAEADDFHPPANIAKMRAGQPLTDEDRWPWLRAIAAWIDERRAAGEHGVVTCSALKRSYRDLLRAGRPEVCLVFLRGSRDLLARRLAARHDHFFPATLLDTQLRDLQPPTPEEHAIAIDLTDEPPEALTERVIAALTDAGSVG
jgi:carbohydrate kinase (thermoresistant glucokinase family)